MRVRWIVTVRVPRLIAVVVGRRSPPGPLGRPTAFARGGAAGRLAGLWSSPPAFRRRRSAGSDGELSVEVVDLTAAERRVIPGAESAGRLPAGPSGLRGGRSRRSSLVLRVPADRFNEAVAAAEELGRVLEASSQTEDVSQAYSDLETRMQGEEAAWRHGFGGILETRTGKLSEVLEIENELARVVEEVERIQAGLLVYDRRIAWSTVKLELRQRAAEVVEVAFLPRFRTRS